MTALTKFFLCKISAELTVLLAATLLISCHGVSTIQACEKAPQPAPSSAPVDLTGLAGHTYQGIHSGEFVPGCEGCGQPGFISFAEKGHANMLWRDDDIVHICTYTNEGSKVHLDCDGNRYTFIASEGNTVLKHNASKFVLKLKK